MYTIEHSKAKNINEIMQVIHSARRIMRQNGNMNQWTDGYPDRQTIIEDIENNNHYCVRQGDKIIGAFTFIKGPDVTYRRIFEGDWLTNDDDYFVIHRIGKLHGHNNVLKTILDFCFRITDNIKIDTHRDNKIMQSALRKYGFTYCGIIYLLNGDERLAFQKIKSL